ncbi:hypothetical protein D1BOALGB6SA_9106 [Olavius sp. associated proteobacterium Delta 1]|nr:hypothetical protein D1BOALGB6SA_9106 [Olavius sp. associated proteobacterium Delta 1]
MRYNRQPAIGISITIVSGVNTVDIGERIDQRLEDITPMLPIGVEAHRVHWQSDIVRESVSSMKARRWTSSWNISPKRLKNVPSTLAGNFSSKFLLELISNSARDTEDRIRKCEFGMRIDRTPRRRQSFGQKEKSKWLLPAL